MTIHDPQGSFEALSQWANATQPQIRLSKSKGGITVLSGDSIITRIFSFFRSSIEASRYSGLKEVMSSLIERVKDKTKAAQERSPEERTAEIQARMFQNKNYLSFNPVCFCFSSFFARLFPIQYHHVFALDFYTSTNSKGKYEA